MISFSKKVVAKATLFWKKMTSFKCAFVDIRNTAKCSDIVMKIFATADKATVRWNLDCANMKVGLQVLKLDRDTDNSGI